MVLPFLVLLAYKRLFLSTLKQGLGKNYRKNHKEKKKIQKNQQNTQNKKEKKVKDCVLKRNEENLDESEIEKNLEIKRKAVKNPEKESTFSLLCKP